jgi:F-type H+-transporting ATPase subunit delta
VTGSRAAKAYARALFAIAKERGQTAEIAADLERAVAVLVEAPEIRGLLARPWLAPAAKRAAAIELATRTGLGPLARDFLALVASQGRLAELESIAAAYRDLVDADLGRVRARVLTAVPLTDAERAQLAARIATQLGAREALVEERVDESVLGGFVAQVGSLVLDGSLSGQLARLRERLASV